MFRRRNTAPRKSLRLFSPLPEEDENDVTDEELTQLVIAQPELVSSDYFETIASPDLNNFRRSYEFFFAAFASQFMALLPENILCREDVVTAIDVLDNQYTLYQLALDALRGDGPLSGERASYTAIASSNIIFLLNRIIMLYTPDQYGSYTEDLEETLLDQAIYIKDENLLYEVVIPAIVSIQACREYARLQRMQVQDSPLMTLPEFSQALTRLLANKTLSSQMITEENLSISHAVHFKI
jgi:hypothetical protein